MRSLIRYAFEINMGLPYLLAFPLVFFAPAPLWFSIAMYIAIAIPFLGIAAAVRRHERKRGYVRASVTESKLRGIANVPKSIGSLDRPSVVGVFARGQLNGCHFISTVVDGRIETLVVSKWWPYRTRDFVSSASSAQWRKWLNDGGARIIPEGRYADAVYLKYLASNLDKS